MFSRDEYLIGFGGVQIVVSTMGGGVSRERFQFREYAGPKITRTKVDRFSSPRMTSRKSMNRQKNNRRTKRVIKRRNTDSPRESSEEPFKLNMADFSFFGKANRNVLGTGFISKVRLLKNKRTAQFFVAKQMSKTDIVKKNALSQVNAEKNFLSQFAKSSACSPFIVQFFGSFQDQQSVFLVYEYLPGGELYRQLKIEGTFSNNQVKFYAAEILCAINYLHQLRILHRDLKPENVMLSADGHVKLIDFGFAKMMNKKGRCFTKLGTANYLAPEMLVHPSVLGRKGYGATAEWWAFGCLVFELLTGSPAFGRSKDSTQSIYEKIRQGQRAKLPGRVDKDATALLDSLLARDPAQRPQTGRQIMAHPWFTAVPWEMLEQQKILPPHIPDIRHPGDTSYFDEYECEPEPRPGRRRRDGGMENSKGSPFRSTTMFDAF